MRWSELYWERYLESLMADRLALAQKLRDESVWSLGYRTGTFAWPTTNEVYASALFGAAKAVEESCSVS